MLTGMTERDWLIALEVFDTVLAQRVWQLEQRMEAVLAPQSVWRLRGVLSDTRGMQRDGAFNPVLR